jgi:DNA end-binding protein Ku
VPSRPYWKGQIRLALVAIPVEIFSATRPGTATASRQIHEPSGKPVRYTKSVAGIGPIDADEILKDFEYERGKYVLLEAEEIEAIKSPRWLRPLSGTSSAI